MSEEQQQAPPPPEGPTAYAATARLADYCAVSPQAWSINSTFAMHRIASSNTKFHMAVSKLPIVLMDTIGHLCDNPGLVADPYVDCLLYTSPSPRD